MLKIWDSVPHLFCAVFLLYCIQPPLFLRISVLLCPAKETEGEQRQVKLNVYL